MITFSMPHSSLSGGNGSRSNTSRPAPAIQPSFSARMSAVSSTTGPRQTLIRTAVDFMARSSASPMRWRVSLESGTERTT